MSQAPADAGASPAADPAVWERWTKKRVFVRALEGTFLGGCVLSGRIAGQSTGKGI